MHITDMNKFVCNKTVITAFLALTNLLVMVLIYLSIFFEIELLHAQQQNTISVVRATAPYLERYGRYNTAFEHTN
jgi:hypothetical protein